MRNLRDRKLNHLPKVKPLVRGSVRQPVSEFKLSIYMPCASQTLFIHQSCKALLVNPHLSEWALSFPDPSVVIIAYTSSFLSPSAFPFGIPPPGLPPNLLLSVIISSHRTPECIYCTSPLRISHSDIFYSCIPIMSLSALWNVHGFIVFLNFPLMLCIPVHWVSQCHLP